MSGGTFDAPMHPAPIITFVITPATTIRNHTHSILCTSTYILQPMIDFVILAHKAHTRPVFKLNDLTNGRMDLLCRCINSALFLSHDLRRDVNIHLIHMDNMGNAKTEPVKSIESTEAVEPVKPTESVIVRFSGENVRYLNPDERSAGSLIIKALEKERYEYEIESTKGVYIRKGDFARLLDEFKERNIIYLREDGIDIREIHANAGTDMDMNLDTVIFNNPVFVLGDHTGVTVQEEALLQDAQAKTISIGPISLHSDHCIILIHNELDRFRAIDGN